MKTLFRRPNQEDPYEANLKPQLEGSALLSTEELDELKAESEYLVAETPGS